MHLSTKSRKGYVLIMVLGSIVLISSIVILFMMKSTERLKVTATENSKEFLMEKAYSALEISLAVINQCGMRDHALRGPQQGWGTPLENVQAHFPKGMQVSATCYDASAKIPLFIQKRDLLLIALEKQGISLLESDKLSDCFLDWMDADNLKRLHGFDGDDYKDAHASYTAPNRNLSSWKELDLIHRWDELEPEKKEAIASYFTLLNTPRININSASEAVIEILQEHLATDLSTLVDFISGDDLTHGTKDDQIIKDLSAYPQLKDDSSFGTQTNLIYIKIEVSYANTNVTLNALVRWNGGSSPDTSEDSEDLSYPFKILQLEENTPALSALEYLY